MAVWNNQVRGNVEAIKKHMGWDPTQIIDSTNPMPTQDDPAAGKKGNMSGLGSPGAGTVEDNSQFSPPGMDKVSIPATPRAGGGKHNPNAGMGDY